MVTLKKIEETSPTTSSGAVTLKKIQAGAQSAPQTTQTRAALPLPSVGVSEPTLLERVGKTLSGAAKSTAAEVVNALGTLSAVSDSYEAAKERMGAATRADEERAALRLPAASGQRSTAELYDTADRLQQQSAQSIQTAKQGLGGVGQFAVNLGAAGAQMAGDIAAGALTGGGALVPMAARVFGGSAQEARQSGATLGQQLAYGAGSAALSVVMEQIANTSGLMQRAFGKSTLAGALAKKFGDKGVTKAITEAVEKMQRTAAGRAAINAISEGGEEFAEAVFQPVLQRATYDKDASFDLGQALYDAAVGGALGVIGGVGERRALPGGVEAQETQNNVEQETAQGEAEQSEADRVRLRTFEELSEWNAAERRNIERRAEQRRTAERERAQREMDRTTQEWERAGWNEAERAAMDDKTERVMQELNLGPVQPEESGVKGMYGYGTTDPNKQAELRRAEEIAKRFGAKFQAMELENGAEGEYKDGTITINPNAKNPTMTLLVHELTHHMETSGLYGRFSDRVLRYLAEDMDMDVGELRGRVAASYANAGVELDEDGVTREIVAKFAQEKLFTDESAIKRFLENDRSLFEKIYDWLRDAVTRLTSTPEANFLLSAEKLYAKALADAGSENADAAENSKRQFLIENGKKQLIKSYADRDRVCASIEKNLKKYVDSGALYDVSIHKSGGMGSYETFYVTVEFKEGEDGYQNSMEIRFSNHDSKYGGADVYLFDGNYAGLRELNNAVVEEIRNYAKENNSPFDDSGGKRFSIETDSEGRELSEQQQEYFKDSKAVDTDGRLKVMYQGGNGDFTVFDRKKSKGSNLYGRGFYFTDSEAQAKQYGGTRAFYLNVTNPLTPGQSSITRQQMRDFLSAVAENEDYGLENYGYGATVDSVLESVYGKGDFEMLQDVNATAIGDLVSAAELFNEVNGTDYDGIILPTETVTFRSNQAKNVTNAAPTVDPDIRNAYGPSLSELMAMPEINTEANRRTEGQSRFAYGPGLSGMAEAEDLRLKTGEEDVRREYSEEQELAAEREVNRQQRLTDADYEQQRRDIDELWEMWGQEATMTREAPEKTDTSELVTAEVKKEEKGFKESVKDLGATFRRKWIDSADAVREIGKSVGDRALYPYFNMARASSNAALNMITTAQTNVKGETVGKSLNEIFEPIRAKGEDYYNLFQTYLFHRHNVDRMSRYNQEAVDKAAAAMQTFKTNNPELLMYEQYQLEEMAQDEWSDYNVEAKEYLRLLRELRKAENTKNKPVFGFGWTAEESRAEADKMLREHPELDGLAGDVYAYARNLMQYRADSGLITEEQKNYIESIYPHYVPTFRWTEDMPLQMNERAVQIGSTIKQAKGGDQKLVPLHKALADQTMSVVREGSKNRFGQRLLRAERSKMEGAKKHLRHVEEAENGFSADNFDDTKDDFSKITNTFTVRSDGKRYDITVSEDLYEGIKALTPDEVSNNRLAKGARRAVDLFKKLCTSMSPTFMIRNPIKDLQDAGLYSKDARAFAAQFPRAAKEISTNGAYWQRYKALGGTYTSFFDYETGETRGRNKLAEKTVGRIETLNNAIEQAPRLAEFMATVKKAGGLENASMDTLMQAMHNAADVTVNFGRSGTIARSWNRYVPFFNAGMQGLSKNVRMFTETKGAKDWTKLVIKCVILGVAPRLANELLFGDRDDWDDLKDEAKDQNYLFPIGENKWFKIPKGRALSTFGLLGNAAANAMSGEEIDARYILSTAADNLAPANPLKNNIFAAAMDSDLFDPSRPGKTWYGGDIESQRLQNYAPAERYDAKTDELSKWLGKTFGLSPKKINYILDQYTGFAGDVILPMMTTAAETSPFVNAFVINSTTNNRLSGDFYDKLDELTFAKNGKDATGADAVTYRWFNKQSSAVSEINTAIREIEADKSLSGKEKKELLEVQYKIRNAAEKSALDTLERYEDAARFYYGTTAGDEEDRVDDAYLKANREVFGAEYALRVYNKQVYDKAVKANEEGVAFDDYLDFYFATRDIEADKDEDGKSISGSKKEKVLAVIDAMDIPAEQKDALYLLEGYAEKKIEEAPWGFSLPKLELPELPELPKLELPELPELPKLELPALELPR